jgi:hypothetical protein
MGGALARLRTIVYARATMRHKVLMLLLLAYAPACAPRLGDGCERNSDCSVQGDRTCDLAQTGGYCTIADCETDTCGDEGRCVRFQPEEPRQARAWCMAKCSDNGDCDRDRYVCRNVAQLNEAAGCPIDPETGDRTSCLAEMLDTKGGKFCVVRVTPPAADTGSSPSED